MPSLALPRRHYRLVALDGAALGLLRAESLGAQQAPDMHLTEAHPMQPLDEDVHSLERPQLSAEVVGRGTL